MRGRSEANRSTMMDLELTSRTDSADDVHSTALSDFVLEETIERQVDESFNSNISRGNLWQSPSPEYHLPTRQERDITIREVKSRRSCCMKVWLSVLLAGIFIFVIVDSATNRHIEKGITAFLEWVETNPGIGFVVFIGVCYVCTLFFFPVSILAPGGGFVFAHAFGVGLGVVLATAAVFVGAGLGAITSFIAGRFLLRDTVQPLKDKYPIIEAIDSVLVEKGVRIIILLHLCPIIPFNVLNCIAGTTSMSAWTYVWTLVAIIPGTIAYVFFGASAGSLADSKNRGGASVGEIVILVVGLTLGTVGIASISHYAKKELRKITEQREAGERTAPSPAVLQNDII